MKKLMTIALGLSLFTGSAMFAADRHPAPGRGDAKRGDQRGDNRRADHRDAGRRDAGHRDAKRR